MRPLVPEAGVTLIQTSSGANETPINNHVFTVAQGALSQIFNLSWEFDFDSGNDAVAGMYNPRLWIENLPKIPGLVLNWAMQAAPEYGITALSGGATIPVLYQPGSNISKATYYNPSNKRIEWGTFQLDATTCTETYDTVEKAMRKNPVLMLEFERESGGGNLDIYSPNANSDHLWSFSEVNIYIEWPRKISGTTYTHRHLIGWTKDETTIAKMTMEMVDFKKGKPKMTAASFISALPAECTFEMGTYDPWFFQEAMHASYKKDSYNRFAGRQYAKQRIISNYAIVMEWFTNAGHLVQFRYPKAQLFCTGDITPGADDISVLAATFKPIIDDASLLIEHFITASIVQRVALPIGITLTA